MTIATIPHRPLSWARIIICLAMAFVFGALALLHGETPKESQIDQHLSFIDGTLKEMQEQRDTMRTKRDNQVDLLNQRLSDNNERVSRDEGIASGAFVALGILQTLGHLRKKQTDD